MRPAETTVGEDAKSPIMKKQKAPRPNDGVLLCGLQNHKAGTTPRAILVEVSTAPEQSQSIGLAV